MLDKSIPHIGVLMVKTDTTKYPRFELPSGYTICGYLEGFEVQWAGLMFEVDQTDTLQEAKDIFEKEFMSLPDLLPKQCLFVLDETGKMAATASLWHGEHFDETYQRIHWVATCPEYQGKGLTKALITKLLDVYNELGYKDFIYLTSQTWSYKAINIYSQFGFVPYMGEKPANWWVDDFDENNRLAWKMINDKIGEYKRNTKTLSPSAKQ